MVGPINPQTFEQIWPDLVTLRLDAGLRALIDRHQAHQPHQTADTLRVDPMTPGPQVPRHLTDTIERRLQELLIDQTHQRQIERRFALGFVVERRARDRQQTALLGNRQAGMIHLNHGLPHLPVQGLSFRSKKSLATASSPILA